ncbi:helix-turn-helix domain-containing protein [Pseudorhodoferax soli]|uniref:XRE family transcriptional regulator n=1 Tax=Pseudorhodoferax soli TaxID=545864 RepID=A0A368XF37_9BURK|nr:XRE family transcriptional regulator [Pseudorhodoferax soli]RCW65107.1 XRE family transcriptional regulator [Pseudorhodoferax soli]
MSRRPKPAEPQSLVTRLGVQVRSLRMGSGLSGQDLALASGVSRSMLSRIERGQVSPSVDTLGCIARGLGVPIARFFAEQADRPEFSLVRKGRGARIESLASVQGYRHELLGHVPSAQLNVEPYLVRLDAKAGAYASYQHPGMKFVHLLSGRLRYRHGATVVAFDAGDSLLLDASALHGVEEIVQGPVSYLAISFTARN